MNRRNFLSTFGAGAAVAATNPVRFFAPAGGWRWHGGIVCANETPFIVPGRIDLIDLNQWGPMPQAKGRLISAGART